MVKRYGKEDRALVCRTRSASRRNGEDLAEQFPTAADLFRRADEILGRKLSDIAWNGPIEELTKTSNCQPALFVHGLACLSILRELAGDFRSVARLVCR